MLGVIGTKLGMTRVFKDNGTSVPVTVIEVAKVRLSKEKHLKKTDITLFKLISDLKRMCQEAWRKNSRIMMQKKDI